MATDIYTSWQVVITIAVVLLLAGYAIKVYIQYRRLAHIEGPMLAALTPFWLFYHTLKGDVYAACQREFNNYGSRIIRVAPNVVTTDDPASFRLWTLPKSQWTRGRWFDGAKFDVRTHNILSMREEQAHSKRRQQLIPGYTGADVPTLEADVDDRVVELLAYIDRHSVKNKAFDLAQAIHFFTLDILTKIGFGEALGFLPKEKDLFDYIKSGEAFFPVMELMCNFPTIRAILQSPLMAGAAPKSTDKIGFGAIIGHAQDVVTKRFSTDDKRDDMLGSFQKQGLTRTELESESLLLILAGADSTATGLRTTLLYIITNPPVYRRLVEEIDAFESTTVISNADAQTLPYLRAVILEGLRMFMPLTGLAGRLPPKGGVVLEGIYIPEGTEIGLSLYTMLRRTDLFGEDADTFRPERWIDGDATYIASMERHHSLIFGSGRSSCLGKNIAMMELRKSVFEIFRSFDLVVVNPIKPIYIKANGPVVQKNFWVRAYKKKLRPTGMSRRADVDKILHEP